MSDGNEAVIDVIGTGISAAGNGSGANGQALAGRDAVPAGTFRDTGASELMRSPASEQFMALPAVEDWPENDLCQFVGRQKLTREDLDEIQWFFDVINGRKGRFRVKSGDGSLRKGQVNIARWARLCVKYPRMYENVRNFRAANSEDLLETLYERVLEALAGQPVEAMDFKELAKALDYVGKLVHRHDRRPVHVGDVIITEKADVTKHRTNLIVQILDAAKNNPTVREAVGPLIRAANEGGNGTVDE